MYELKKKLDDAYWVSKYFLRRPNQILTRGIPGMLQEYEVKKSGNPAILQDLFGNKYWQYPSDRILYNWIRNAVFDSRNVAVYVLNHSNLKPGCTCIDIGADVGAMSIALWSVVGVNGKVITVEAMPEKIDKIKANLALNGYPQDYVINAAISDREEVRQMRCYPDSDDWNTFGEVADFATKHKFYTIDLKTISFEQLQITNQLEAIDLVKIDTEGAELLVLKGMRSFLKDKKIDRVIFEVNNPTLKAMNTNVEELMSFWEEFDYELWQIGLDGKLEELQRDWMQTKNGDCVAIARK